MEKYKLVEYDNELIPSGILFNSISASQAIAFLKAIAAPYSAIDKIKEIDVRKSLYKAAEAVEDSITRITSVGSGKVWGGSSVNKLNPGIFAQVKKNPQNYTIEYSDGTVHDHTSTRRPTEAQTSFPDAKAEVLRSKSGAFLYRMQGDTDTYDMDLNQVIDPDAKIIETLPYTEMQKHYQEIKQASEEQTKEPLKPVKAKASKSTVDQGDAIPVEISGLTITKSDDGQPGILGKLFLLASHVGNQLVGEKIREFIESNDTELALEIEDFGKNPEILELAQACNFMTSKEFINKVLRYKTSNTNNIVKVISIINDSGFNRVITAELQKESPASLAINALLKNRRRDSFISFADILYIATSKNLSDGKEFNDHLLSLYKNSTLIKPDFALGSTAASGKCKDIIKNYTGKLDGINLDDAISCVGKRFEEYSKLADANQPFDAEKYKKEIELYNFYKLVMTDKEAATDFSQYVDSLGLTKKEIPDSIRRAKSAADSYLYLTGKNTEEAKSIILGGIATSLSLVSNTNPEEIRQAELRAYVSENFDLSYEYQKKVYASTGLALELSDGNVLLKSYRGTPDVILTKENIAGLIDAYLSKPQDSADIWAAKIANRPEMVGRTVQVADSSLHAQIDLHSSTALQNIALHVTKITDLFVGIENSNNLEFASEEKAADLLKAVKAASVGFGARLKFEGIGKIEGLMKKSAQQEINNFVGKLEGLLSRLEKKDGVYKVKTPMISGEFESILLLTTAYGVIRSEFPDVSKMDKIKSIASGEITGSDYGKVINTVLEDTRKGTAYKKVKALDASGMIFTFEYDGEKIGVVSQKDKRSKGAIDGEVVIVRNNSEDSENTVSLNKNQAEFKQSINDYQTPHLNEVNSHIGTEVAMSQHASKVNINTTQVVNLVSGGKNADKAKNKVNRLHFNPTASKINRSEGLKSGVLK